MVGLTDVATAAYYSTAWVAVVTAWVYALRLYTILRIDNQSEWTPEIVRAYRIAWGIVLGFTAVAANELYFGYLRTFVFAPDYNLQQVVINVTIKWVVITAGLFHVWADSGRFRPLLLQSVAVYFASLVLVVLV